MNIEYDECRVIKGISILCDDFLTNNLEIILRWPDVLSDCNGPKDHIECYNHKPNANFSCIIKPSSSFQNLFIFQVSCQFIFVARGPIYLIESLERFL